MRVDKYLSILGLVRRSSFKKEGILIKVNGNIVKPSKNIKVGDVVEFQSPTLTFKIEVVQLPKSKSIKSQDRKDYFKIIQKETRKKEITSEFIKWLLKD